MPEATTLGLKAKLGVETDDKQVDREVDSLKDKLSEAATAEMETDVSTLKSNIVQSIEEAVDEAKWLPDMDLGESAEAGFTDDDKSQFKERMEALGMDMGGDPRMGSSAGGGPAFGGGGGGGGGPGMTGELLAGMKGAGGKFLKVGLAGAVGLGILSSVSSLSDAAPRFQKNLSMMSKAIGLFARPFFDWIARWTEDGVMNLLDMAANFNQIYAEEGLLVAISKLPQMFFTRNGEASMQETLGRVVGGLGGAAGGAYAGMKIGGAAGALGGPAGAGIGAGIGGIVGGLGGLLVGAGLGGEIAGALEDVTVEDLFDQAEENIDSASESFNDMITGLSPEEIFDKVDADKIIEFHKDMFTGSIQMNAEMFKFGIDMQKDMFLWSIEMGKYIWDPNTYIELGQWMWKASGDLADWIDKKFIDLTEWIDNEYIDLTNWISDQSNWNPVYHMADWSWNPLDYISTGGGGDDGGFFGSGFGPDIGPDVDLPGGGGGGGGGNNAGGSGEDVSVDEIVTELEEIKKNTEKQEQKMEINISGQKFADLVDLNLAKYKQSKVVSR